MNFYEQADLEASVVVLALLLAFSIFSFCYQTYRNPGCDHQLSIWKEKKEAINKFSSQSFSQMDEDISQDQDRDRYRCMLDTLENTAKP